MGYYGDGHKGQIVEADAAQSPPQEMPAQALRQELPG
jgi:hypothetical protein